MFCKVRCGQCPTNSLPSSVRAYKLSYPRHQINGEVKVCHFQRSRCSRARVLTRYVHVRFSRFNTCNRLDMAILPSHIGGGCRATSDGNHADGGNGPQQLADSAGQLHEDAKDQVHQMVITRTISVLLVLHGLHEIHMIFYLHNRWKTWKGPWTRIHRLRLMG